jgi:hypothetical protein
MSTRSPAVLLATALCAGASAGCYHFTFQQQAGPRSAEGPTIRHEVRAPTFLNGFVGNGTVDTSTYCDRPVRTELRVTALDVMISMATLLVYTPHTLYVTCRVEDDKLWRVLGTEGR